MSRLTARDGGDDVGCGDAVLEQGEHDDLAARFGRRGDGDDAAKSTSPAGGDDVSDSL